MTEQQQREKLEKAHAAWDREFKEREIELPVAHQHRGILLTWLRERDEQIASLQRELARFQRADVGERVRELEQVLINDPPITDAGRWCGGSTWHAALKAGQDAVDICRQQAAGIERLRASVQSWEQAKETWTSELTRMQTIVRSYEDAPTDKHERVEPFEEFEGLAFADDDKTRVITTLCRTALALSHLNASRIISRADNNKLFEIPWSLLAFAENILNNYGSGGLWLCVHCIIAHAASEERCGTCGTERHEWDQKQTSGAAYDAAKGG